MDPDQAFTERAHEVYSDIPAMPSLFGRRSNQDLLCEIFQNGCVPKPKTYHLSLPLSRSGVVAVVYRRRRLLLLDSRHPAAEAIETVLAALSGNSRGITSISPAPKSEHSIDTLRPLGHQSPLAFRVLVLLVRANGPLSSDALRRRMPDAAVAALKRTLNELERDGVLIQNDLEAAIAPTVPESYCFLVRCLAELLAPRDPRLAETGVIVGARPISFSRAEDGAPLLFGSDVRLRNLMALAKHGPMYVSELMRLTGVQTPVLESRDHAPFGRGSIVRTWRGPHGPAADLNPAHPIFLSLRRFLWKMETYFPLPPHFPNYDAPIGPQPKAWRGDKYALFGGEITTSILLSVGVLGWTYEGLCVSLCNGYARVAVKKVVRRLEDQGILEADRGRRPGFNVRVLKLAPSFPGTEELYDLLKACVFTWPAFRDQVLIALEYRPSRARAHLRKRGLLLAEDHEDGALTEDLRDKCLHRYFALVTNLGRPLPSHEVMRLDSNLYRAIRAAWGSFSKFRERAGLPPVMAGESSSANPRLRDRCIAEYRKLAARVGYQPNTADLNRLAPGLSERIRVQWGGFPELCDELQLSPARRKRNTKAPESERREDCRAEYRSVTQRLGYTPACNELRLHTAGLYKRIMKLWNGFEEFCDDIGVEPRRRRRKDAAASSG